MKESPASEGYGMLRGSPPPAFRTRVISALPPGAWALAGTRGPVLCGGGEASYLCGACDGVLAEHVQPYCVMGIVFKCPRCSALSQVVNGHPNGEPSSA